LILLHTARAAAAPVPLVMLVMQLPTRLAAVKLPLSTLLLLLWVTAVVLQALVSLFRLLNRRRLLSSYTQRAAPSGCCPALGSDRERRPVLLPALLLLLLRRPEPTEKVPQLDA
jgi:hypothetical protein